jgi:acyl carrier protein
VNTRYRVQAIFREVFDDPRLEIRDSMSVETFPEWDSVATVHLILAVEAEFGIRFSTDQVAGVQSVADLLRVLEAAPAKGS